MPKYVRTHHNRHLINFSFKGTSYQFSRNARTPEEATRIATEILAQLHAGTLHPDDLYQRRNRPITVQTQDGPLSFTKQGWAKHLNVSLRTLYNHAKSLNTDLNGVILAMLRRQHPSDPILHTAFAEHLKLK